MTFESQADGAAASLKAKMGLPSKTVEVDSNGNPAPPPPPPGSYAEQIRNAQRPQETQEAVEVAQPQVTADAEPVAQTPAQEPRTDTSENAQRRIQELVAQVKEARREAELLRSRVSTSEREQADQRLQEEEPDEPSAPPMTDLQEALRRQREEFESRLRPLAEKAKLDDLERVARKYPGYDSTVHPELIDLYRQKNPASTIEQAFRAVATDEELTRGTVRPAAIPPTVAPSGSSQPRSIPEPEPDPADQEASEMQQLMEQARSLSNMRDPAAARQRDRIIRELLARKTGLK